MEIIFFNPFRSVKQKINLVFNIFKNRSIVAYESPNIEECDVVFLDRMDGMFLDDNFYESLEVYKKYKDHSTFKNKNHIFFLFHEVNTFEILHEKLDKIITSLEIEPSKLFFYDSSLLSYLTNNIPLELKLKQYSFPKFDFIENERKNKITFLNGNVYQFRLCLIDKLFHAYDNNVELIRSENLVSIRNVDFLLNFGIENKYIYNDSSFYIKIFNEQLPWIPSDNDFRGKENSIELAYHQLIEYHGSSIFSIISETQSNTFYIDSITGKLTINDDESLSTYQIGEKTITGILGMSFTILVVDPIYYKELENIGFDFSYLKSIFGIDYKNISFLEFYNSLDGIFKFIKESTIDELNKLRNDYLEILIHNKKLMENVVHGDFSQTELEFFKKLANK